MQFLTDDKFFWGDPDKNRHLNSGNDKDQATFFYVAASDPLHLVLFFIH